MQDQSTSEPSAVAGEQAETRGHIYDLVSRVGTLEGSVRHLATKADVEKAKYWIVAAIAAAILSVLSLMVSVYRLYLLLKTD